MIHREWILQEQVLWFVERAIAVPCLFMCHDSAGKKTDEGRFYEAKRGIRPGWPDTELCLNGGRTFRCELKARGARVMDGSAQDFIRGKLNALGHRCTEANTVLGYGEACDRFSVPLKGNWRTIAQLADERVAANIREKELKEAEKKAAAAPPSEIIVLPKKRPGRPSTAQIKRVFAAIKPL